MGTDLVQDPMAVPAGHVKVQKDDVRQCVFTKALFLKKVIHGFLAIGSPVNLHRNIGFSERFNRQAGVNQIILHQKDLNVSVTVLGGSHGFYRLSMVEEEKSAGDAGEDGTTRFFVKTFYPVTY